MTDNPLKQAAHEVYLEHGFCEGAVENLERMILTSKELRKQAIHLMAYDLLREAQRMDRAARVNEGYAREPMTYEEGLSERLKVSCARYKGLYGFPLMDGTRLWDATWEQIDDSAKRYWANAEGNAVRARFLDLVIAGRKPGKTFQQVYKKEEMLQSLMEKAKENGETVREVS